MIHYLDVPVYKTNVVFLVETTEDEWRQYYEEDTSYLTENDYLSVLDDINNPDNGDGTTTMTDGGSFIIYIRDRHSHGDIAHEIFHAANWILVNRKVTHDESAEPWAYLIGWFTDVIYEVIEKMS